MRLLIYRVAVRQRQGNGLVLEREHRWRGSLKDGPAWKGLEGSSGRTWVSLISSANYTIGCRLDFPPRCLKRSEGWRKGRSQSLLVNGTHKLLTSPWVTASLPPRLGQSKALLWEPWAQGARGVICGPWPHSSAGHTLSPPHSRVHCTGSSHSVHSACCCCCCCTRRAARRLQGSQCPARGVPHSPREAGLRASRLPINFLCRLLQTRLNSKTGTGEIRKTR